MKLTRIVLLACIAGGSFAHAKERITSFVSDLTVHEQGYVTIKEKITVHAQGHDIRHGIVREIPTRYQDEKGNNFIVPFSIQRTMLDGYSITPYIEDLSNGKAIFIRNFYQLTPGKHVFIAEYRLDRVIGFFEKHDEIYWNVTGNGWQLPIDHVIARIHLPSDVSRNELELEAYTGYVSEKNTLYTTSVGSDGVIECSTTANLGPYQGLTVVVGWPKGFVQTPSLFDHMRWFFIDHIHILMFLFGLFFILAILIASYRRNARLKPTTPIIPLFYPPQDLTPGMVCVIDQMNFNHKAVAADVVHMAVNGWVGINYKPGWMSEVYTLEKKEKPHSEWYQNMYAMLFKKADSVDLSNTSNISVHGLIELVKKKYNQDTKDFFDTHPHSIFSVCIVACGLVFMQYVLAPYDNYLALFSGIAYAVIIAIGYTYLCTYTRKGWEIKNQIDGFKLFLETTEEERIRLIGTPPTKTPELYEKYLPYAIALGVEKAWSLQFAPLFKELEQHNAPYTPLWIYGPRFEGFRMGSFSSSLASGLSSTISASSILPGSSSGFSSGSGRGGSGGGGGFSGGGFGGGGGRGC